MTVRRTSAECYRIITDSGLLSKRRWEIYDIVYRHGPLTSGEAYEKMLQEGKMDRLSALTQSRARFTELKVRSVLEEVDERACTVTGHKAIVWAVTCNLPVEPPKKEKPIRYKEVKDQITQLLELIEQSKNSIHQETVDKWTKAGRWLEQKIKTEERKKT